MRERKRERARERRGGKREERGVERERARRTHHAHFNVSPNYT